MVLVCVAGAATLLAGLSGRPASARPLRQIDVFPGPNALTNALAEARPGDALELHTGTYSEAVTITTPTIALEPAGDGPVTIDGGCAAFETIAVRADGVTLEGAISVVGGMFYEVNYAGVRSGILEGFTMTDTCGNATFAVFVQSSGAVLVSSNTISGFGGAGIDLFDITDTAGSTLLVSSNDIAQIGRGITVEQSAGGSIQVRGNRVRGSEFSGINLTNSDGVAIQRNRVSNDGQEGIALDADSSGNSVIGNAAFGNTFDLVNFGQGNCFRANRFRTSRGTIGC